MRAWIAGWTAAAALTLGGGAAAQPASSSAQVEAAFQAARQVSPVPLSLDREQAEWREYGDQGAEGVSDRLAELTARAARDRAAWDLRTTVEELAGGCVPIALSDCSTVSGGYVAHPDGQILYWQIQRGVTEWDGVGGGFVLLQADADGVLRPAAWDFAGFAYETPVWAEGSGQDQSPAFIAVAGVHGGTGAQNADVIFRLADDTRRPLVQVDNFSWRDDLDARLPEGLEVWKGVDFRYPALAAFTSLWTPRDANCCPTGGEAMLEFQLEPDRLVLSGVNVTEAHQTLIERMPADVYAYLQRRRVCAHWAGEEPYDAERAAQIAQAVAEQRCDALDADGAALRRIHAEDETLIQAMARAEAL